MSPRTTVNIAIVVSLLFLPWWVALISALVGIFFVSNFYELALWGGLYDVLFGIPSDHFHHTGLIVGSVFVLISFWLKKSFARNV